MNATIITRQNGSVCLLDVSGKITLGDGSVVIREAVKKLVADGTKNIVLNLGDVTYIDLTVENHPAWPRVYAAGIMGSSVTWYPSLRKA